MKKMNRKLMVSMLSGIMLFSALNPGMLFAKESEEVQVKSSLKFGVISDTHVGPNKEKENTRLGKAFEFFTREGVKSVAVVGDLTDSGTKEQYDVFREIRETYLGEEVDLRASMGNHEGNTAKGFLEATGNKPVQDKVIDGYHFITLSPGYGPFNAETGKGLAQGGGNYSYLTGWLKERLEAAVQEDPNKPIFVSFHHPIKNTFYVSEEWHGSGLDKVFEEYPQVVSFSGHIHSPNNHPRSIWQDGGYTAVNTASLSYFELERGMVTGSVPPNAGECNQGMIIEVEGSQVTIDTYDFNVEEKIQSWSFDVTKPLPYTAARSELSEAPYFEADAKVTVKEIGLDTAKITITQAKTTPNTVGDIVHSYRYDFVNTKTGEIDLTFKAWSDFYITPMPKSMTQTAKDLQPGTTYEVRVYPINAYNKMSETFISTRFTTQTEESKELKLKAPSEITAGKILEVVVGIDQIKEVIYAEDFSFGYDKGLFELIEVEAIVPTVISGKDLASNRVITASIEGIGEGDEALILKFRAKDVDEATTGNIEARAELGWINEGVASKCQTAVSHTSVTVNPSVEEEISEDINGDGQVDVADLALVAYYYHVTSDDTELWEVAKKADLNKDKKIDIQDLSILTSKILE